MKTRIEYRRRLLATVSAVALLGCIHEAGASGNDADRPTLWIEFGGQLERVGGGSELLSLPFMAAIPQDGFTSPLGLEKKLAYAYGGDGRISFQPESSDWIFSAAYRFGRAHGGKHLHEQTQQPPFYASPHYPSYPINVAKFSDTHATNNETHGVVDFTAGKDLGIGILGRDGKSTVSFGLRYAEFHAQSDILISARPELHLHVLTFGNFHYPLKYHHTYDAGLRSDRSFSGVGPTISWQASAPLAGNMEDGEMTLDWGVNAGLLFGRQRAKVHHHTTAQYYSPKYGYGHKAYHILYQNQPPDQRRSKTVTVPNIGGFAGISARYSNAKISIGYRADVFLGALDGGIDAHKNYNHGFYGPFASISFGISPSDF